MVALVAIAFCSCGYTSAQVRTWNNENLATPAGQVRIDRAVTAEIKANPPANAPFITQTGRVVKRRSREIAAHTLAWFKKNYNPCSKDEVGCHAMRNCLIAAVGTFATERGLGVPVKTARRDATVACIVAAFTTIGGGKHVRPAVAARVAVPVPGLRGHRRRDAGVPLALAV